MFVSLACGLAEEVSPTPRPTLRGVIVAGTPSTLSKPTLAPTPFANPDPFELGTWFSIAEGEITLVNVRVVETWPEDSEYSWSIHTPPEGAKYVAADATWTNTTGRVQDFPHLHFYLVAAGDDEPFGCQEGHYSGGDRREASDGFDYSKLYPDISFSGWLLWEVPVAFDLTTATITLSNHYASCYDDPNIVGVWSLGGN